MNPTFFGQPVALVVALISAFVSLLIPFIAAFWAVRKLRHDLRKEVQGVKYTNTLIAHQAFWKLLAYTTDTENAKSAIRWESGKDKSKTFFLQKKNAHDFLDALAKTFYDEGHGLFLPKGIRALFFEYRSILYGLLLKTKNDAGEEAPIQNPELANRLSQLHQEIVVALRESLNVREPELPERP